MNERKRRADTKLVGFQGQPVHGAGWNTHSAESRPETLTLETTEALDSAPPLEALIALAGEREAEAIARFRYTDAQVSEQQALEALWLSRTQLELAGFLRG